MSWVYTLTAQGTTHGFERGYFAFLGDPFGRNVTTGNLRETFGPSAPSAVPEPSTWSLMLSGLAVVFAWRRRTQAARRSSRQ